MSGMEDDGGQAGAPSEVRPDTVREAMRLAGRFTAAERVPGMRLEVYRSIMRTETMIEEWVQS